MLSDILHVQFSPSERLVFIYLPVVIVGILAIMMRRRLAIMMRRPFGWAIVLLCFLLAVIAVSGLVVLIIGFLMMSGAFGHLG